MVRFEDVEGSPKMLHRCHQCHKCQCHHQHHQHRVLRAAANQCHQHLWCQWHEPGRSGGFGGFFTEPVVKMDSVCVCVFAMFLKLVKAHGPIRINSSSTIPYISFESTALSLAKLKDK